MPSVLRYGADSKIAIELPSKAVVADCGAEPGAPLEDPVAAVAAALCDPAGFPPLVEATVPGDRVAVALGDDVPQSAAVVAGVVHTLLHGRTEPREIDVVRTRRSADLGAADPRSLLPPDVRDAVHLVTHDPSDPSQLCHLGAALKGESIGFSRTLCDADVVVAIGCVRAEESPGYLGAAGDLFPMFSDDATRQRFFAPGSVDSPVHHRRRMKEASEALRLLGVRFTVQIIPAAAGKILHVLAGDVDAVAPRARERCRSVWNFDVPRRADLVVAAIDGDDAQQTWENFGRALFAASRVVADGGAIAVCSEMRCRPGPALRQLAAADDAFLALREIRRQRDPEAAAAAQLAGLLDRVAVYLLSGLDAEDIEVLGMGCVSSAGEIARLSTRHELCILLSNAQYAVPTVADEEA